MSSLIRRNSNRDVMSVSEAMNRLFDEAFVMPFGALGRGTFGPNVDVIENENDIVVKAEMPGLKPEDIDVRVEGDVLTLSAETKTESEKTEGKYHLHERSQSSFSRTLQLPVNVQSDKATASFENGVLTLTLPKHEAAKPKKIAIQANGHK